MMRMVRIYPYASSITIRTKQTSLARKRFMLYWSIANTITGSN